MNRIELKPPILITGARRSGTSMIAGIINMCGAFGGIMENPAGEEQHQTFGNWEIHEQIVKPYLQSIVADPDGQFPLPDIKFIPIDWRGQIERIMLDEGYQGGPWMYKGSDPCLLWPIWNYTFPNAKWIIVRRKTSDIVQSCLKTRFMRAFKEGKTRERVGAVTEEEGWLWWVHQHEQRFIEMIQAGLNCKLVWPERMVHGDYAQMYETIEWLGLRWKSKVLEFVDPKWWKIRKHKEQAWQQGQQPQR